MKHISHHKKSMFRKFWKSGSARLRLAIAAGIGLLLISFSALYAQNADTAGIYMTGRVHKNEVWLRWAASTPELWQSALAKGWILERYDFDTLQISQAVRRNMPYHPKKTLVVIPPFLNIDTARLSVMADRNEYAAVLGEAVFGSDLSLTMGGVSVSAWNQVSREMERKQLRFVMANLAYDRSFEVACIGSMGYVDKQIEKGHYYLYRLYAAWADTSCSSRDTAMFFTRMEPGFTLPPIQEIKTKFTYGMVQLEWNVSFAQKQSVGYYVERIDMPQKNAVRQKIAPYSRNMGGGRQTWVCPDGYVRLNNTPLSVLQQRESVTMRYCDSLPDMESRYAYRVIGVDLFGQEFIVAQSHAGKSGLMPLAVAVIDSVKPDLQGSLSLHWSYPQENMASVESFSLYVTSSPDWDESKARLMSSRIFPATRAYTLSSETLGVSSYFYVKTIGKDGQSTLSRAYFYWNRDSIPPLPPQGLSYSVDSLGVVCIRWQASTDRDLDGYRVFRQHGKNTEPVQLTSVTLTDTVFYDTISLHTRQSFLYSVRSVDISGNISAPSALLSVKNLLPDIPAPAVFSNKTHREGNRLELVWYNSHSSGVCGHRLLYKVDSSSWFPLKDFPVKADAPIPETSTFSFTFPERHYTTCYTFNIVAYGLDPEKDTANTPFEYITVQRPAIKAPNLWAIADIENRYVQIQWKSRYVKPLRRLFIYRRSEDGPLHLLATLTPAQAQSGYYTDLSVKMNTEYTYFVQLEFGDGDWSGYSGPCTIEY